MKKPLLGRAGRLLGALAVGTTLFSVIALSGAVPAGAVTYHGGGVVSHKDTPDPDVVYSGHGTTYYTYSTGTMGLVTADWTNGGIGYTPLSCTSGGCGITGVAHTALTAYTHPSIPRGVNLGLFGLQAPSVVHLNSGTWVMYYGAVDAGSPHNAYAVWVATATHPTATDGFTSSLTEGPIMYQKTTGGSTDPSVFTSPSGTRSLQWKSSTYRTDGDKARLWSMPLTATGLQISGSASILITQPTTGWDKTTIENPDMIYSGGTYDLFFSGGLWTTTGYGEGYVTCSGPTGGCGSPTGAPFLSNSSSVPYGPGGASLFPSVTGSWQIAYHGWNTSCTKYATSCNGLRQLYVSQMTGLAATPLPKITSFTASPSSLPATGGTVTFSVISPNMTNYSISSSPTVAGLPAQRPTIHLPANTNGSPITYTFTVTTNNTVGFQTATASVTVAAGSALTGPAVVYDNTFHVVYLGTNNYVYNDGFTPTSKTWLNQELPTSLQAQGSPTAVVYDNTFHVVYLGTNNYVYNDGFTPTSKTWLNQELPTSLQAQGSPTAVVYDNTFHVVYLGTNNYVYNDGFTPTSKTWLNQELPTSLQAQGSPTAVVYDNTFHVVYLGTNNYVYNDGFTPTSKTWLNQELPTSLQAQGSPTAVVYNNTFHVVYLGTNNYVYNDGFTPTSKTWLNQELPTSLQAQGSPTAVVYNNTFHVVYLGTNNYVYNDGFTPTSKTWLNQELPTSLQAQKSPTAVVYNNTFHVVYLGTNNYVYNDGFTPTSKTWLNQELPTSTPAISI